MKQSRLLLGAFLVLANLCTCAFPVSVTTTCDEHSDCIDGYLCDLDQKKCIVCKDCIACSDNGPCDDGDPCTEDTCPSRGICTSEPISGCINCESPSTCDDNDPCTDDTCSASGACEYAFNTAPCDDGIFCNGAEICDGQGTCIDDPPVPCTGNVCDDEDDVCRLDLSWKAVTLGSGHVCALTIDGEAYCWGWNKYGQLGTGNQDGSNIPVKVDTSTIIDGATTFDQIASLAHLSCGIATDGKAYCWGINDSGQLGNGESTGISMVPVAVDTSGMEGEKTFLHISNGRYHACGVATDGIGYCWGGDQFGMLGNGDGLDDSPIPVKIDTSTITGSTTFEEIECGFGHTCGITTDGVAYCWGSNSSGQTGSDSGQQVHQSPVVVDTSNITGDKGFEQISAGSWHTCGINKDSVAYCWGLDSNGVLGNGDENGDTAIPGPVDVSALPVGHKWIRLTSSYNSYSCGLLEDRTAYCWGSNSLGQAGTGETIMEYQSPALVVLDQVHSQGLQSIDVGGVHACGIDMNNKIFCWGSDDRDQLGGFGGRNHAVVPMQVIEDELVGLEFFGKLTTGGSHTCGVTNENKAYCWGSNYSGQLGMDAQIGFTMIPNAVDTSMMSQSPQFIEISAGYSHTCGINSENTVFCFGDNTYGQLGIGEKITSNSFDPVPIDTSGIQGDTTFELVTAGGSYGNSHTCGIATDGKGYCWGEGKGLGYVDAGEDGTSPIAVDVSGISGSGLFLQMTSGNNITCGITTDNLAYCWGENIYGQLGCNDNDDHLIPIAINTSNLQDKSFSMLTAGDKHVCGITTDDKVFCWGDNYFGELGIGKGIASINIPTELDTNTISGDATFETIDCGDLHTCGITTGNLVYCWGYDYLDQIGEGYGPMFRYLPVAVDLSVLSGSEVFVNISAGGDHTCGLTSGDKAYCWGSGMSGQLGIGENFSRVPVPIKTQVVP